MENHLSAWGLSAPELLAETATGRVYRVRRGEETLALKIIRGRGLPFAARGADALAAFAGEGAARLLARAGDAQLLEYVEGPDLAAYVRRGRDEEATTILAETVARLHARPLAPPATLISLPDHFASLFRRAGAGGLYAAAAAEARRLLAEEHEPRVLHGDIHHENIRWSAARGWLAIDPHGVYGDPAYETANSFQNPLGFGDVTEAIERRAAILSARLGLARRRLLGFAFAHGALSAAWSEEDGGDPAASLRVAAAIHSRLTT